MSIINKPDYKIFANDAKTGELEMFPDVLRGWGVTIDRTAGKPPMEWFNALGKRTDEWMMYLSQRGLSEWDVAVDYPQYAVVQHAGKFYTAKKQTRGQRPDQSQNEWMLFADAIGIAKSIIDALNEKQPKGDYATNSALNAVNDNANTRLEKSKNGADIPNKPKFVENLGLAETKKQAENAVPNSRKINGKSLTGDVNLHAGDVGALSAFGGTIISDNKIIELKNATAGAANYIYGTDSGGNARYLLGCGAGAGHVSIVNARTDTHLVVGDKHASIDGKQLATLENIPAIPKNTLMKSTTGYWRCADTGMILQWGTISRAGSDVTFIQFPTLFSTECVNVQMTLSLSTSASGASTINVQSRDRTQTGFTAIMGENETQCNWFAVGY
ncbi:hypothetical protein KKJ13_12345 [Xenorhabdus bovienii]|uniref:gp53-like domain-containing protein n=1 Tax=Xenorhabdus bovienii TaxID=40576 RepID=UPI0023B336EC|nr:hypothetical protein [Xenorhabdus bovienii]MDE9442375.1 hypothetical protein [Xenorhabdus bovienii]